MADCPTCDGELVDDHIGGTSRQHQGRRVLICGTCRVVYPFEPRRELHLVTSRRDLA